MIGRNMHSVDYEVLSFPAGIGVVSKCGSSELNLSVKGRESYSEQRVIPRPLHFCVRVMCFVRQEYNGEKLINTAVHLRRVESLPRDGPESPPIGSALGSLVVRTESLHQHVWIYREFQHGGWDGTTVVVGARYVFRQRAS